ncbi:MAG: lysophospholipase [Bacteroidota bacterium]|nr:alpha/beta fold hydrolase [Flavisolibacter sp.]MBD0350415.1 alpha/beta fold hydrolase [Flavisolibacter sp.]MDQ3843827.1 lysophospholipase [Bacteroidota bacterium]
MKKRSTIKTLLLFITMIILWSCSRLDENLFNPNEHKISEYKLDNYTGEVDFRLGAAYKIPDSLIKLFTLSSQAPGETNATKIWAVYIGSMRRLSTDTIIVYCHGNKDHMDFYWPRAQLLANMGGKNRYGVLMMDYRGYGLSEGKPSENALYADVNAALQWLKTNGVTNNRLIMYGFSMGTAPATKLTAEPRSMTPAKLMLEAPFASAKAMVQDATALALPGTFVTDLQINNAEEIKKVTQPFFWIHGVADDFLAMETQGEVVFKNYGGQSQNKVAYRIPSANHSTIPNTMSFENYLKAVNDFIVRRF